MLSMVTVDVYTVIIIVITLNIIFFIFHFY